MLTCWSYWLSQVSSAAYDRQGVADHANNLASKIRSNLTNSMKALGVDILTGVGTIVVSQLLSLLLTGVGPTVMYTGIAFLFFWQVVHSIIWTSICFCLNSAAYCSILGNPDLKSEYADFEKHKLRNTCHIWGH
jgi:hypothetical protein